MILVFGKTGQLASELAKIKQVKCLSRADANLIDPSACFDVVLRYKPKGVIIAAAFTDVDGAEENLSTAVKVNSDSPGKIALACKVLDIPLIYVSTDYVFDGTGSKAWLPNDAVNPINAYGLSKVLGERNVINAKIQSVILRTSWVFSPYGKNFVNTMTKLGQTQTNIRVVNDQIGGPTPAIDLAKACIHIMDVLIGNQSIRGIFHYSGIPHVTWFEFAQHIFEVQKVSPNLTAVASADYFTIARRPHNSILDCNSTKLTFNLECPNWLTKLQEMLYDQWQ